MIDVKEIGDKGLLDAGVIAVDKVEVKGKTEGTGPLLAVLHNGEHGLITLRYRMKGVAFEALEKEFSAGGVPVPAGS